MFREKKKTFIPQQRVASPLRGLEMLVLTMFAWSSHVPAWSVDSPLGLACTHIRILCDVHLVDSSGVLKRAVLQGPWTHLSRLLMKTAMPGAQQAASCIIFRHSSWQRKQGNIYIPDTNRILCFDLTVTFKFKIAWWWSLAINLHDLQPCPSPNSTHTSS